MNKMLPLDFANKVGVALAFAAILLLLSPVYGSTAKADQEVTNGSVNAAQDEVLIYNRALADYEVANLYTCGH